LESKPPPPNPFGKKGGPAHQQKIDEIFQDIKDRGLIPRTEERVITEGGGKSSRYVDVSALDPATGKVVERYQVGKQTKAGNPVKREVRAMDDIEAADGLRPTSVPYNERF
jgi:hypothetical protein